MTPDLSPRAQEALDKLVAQHPPDFIPPESTAKGRTSGQIAHGIARSARARCAPFWRV